MKRFLRGTVEVQPADVARPPKALRVRLRHLEYADDVQVVEGIVIGEPVSVRVLYDASTPMGEASRLAATLRKIADDIDRHVAAWVANGGGSGM